jgi:hypothetical protein
MPQNIELFMTTAAKTSNPTVVSLYVYIYVYIYTSNSWSRDVLERLVVFKRAHHWSFIICILLQILF